MLRGVELRVGAASVLLSSGLARTRGNASRGRRFAVIRPMWCLRWRARCRRRPRPAHLPGPRPRPRTQPRRQLFRTITALEQGPSTKIQTEQRPGEAPAAMCARDRFTRLVIFRLRGRDHPEEGVALLLGRPIAAPPKPYLVAHLLKHLDRAALARRKVFDGVQVAAQQL